MTFDTETAAFEIVEEAEFFPPTATDLLDELLGQYDTARARIDQVAGLMAGDLGNVVHYFVEGNCSDDRYSPGAAAVTAMFGVPKAIAALNSAYWSKTMGLTDVYNAMPQKRRDEWNESIRTRTTPNFEEDTVRSTISGLLGMRQTFFAERVDGIFRSLSRDHVTNVPEGFSKRMILGYMIGDWGSPNSNQVGVINDLRAVIAKFMGRGEPHWNATDAAVRQGYAKHGEWLTVDGGALRIRVYLKGTAHLEVHPEIAYRLNQVLAHLYPMAIPSEFRTKPKKKAKEFVMMGRPLPFAVLSFLSNMRENKHIPMAVRLSTPSEGNKAAHQQARDVLEAIGGTHDGDGLYQFDYEPGPVIAEIITSGCLPDQVAHQYYPTPAWLAQRAVDAAEIGPDDVCLEPSAGQGGIADLMPGALCIEVSPLHCKILEAKGHTVVQADFIKWAEQAMCEGNAFDKIVMNPPYSEGRWQAHTRAAAELVAPGGRLVAILPASAPNKFTLPGFDLEWSSPIERAFPGVSIAVVILVAVRHG